MNKFIKLYKDKTWLQKMYWENELTLIEIGKLCSVYASTVFEWMKYFNINRRNIPSKKTRDRKSRIQKGKKYSEESKKKMSEAHKGKKASIETKKKLSESKKGEKHPLWGKKHNKETKEKISKANKGKKRSLEFRKKRSEAYQGKKNPFWGKKHSPEIIVKMVNSKKGYVHSEETRNKISEANSGEKCHFWQGGISFEPYGQEFNKKLKEKIRTRDNHQCQECNYNQNKLGYKLCVHHIDYDKKNNNPNNLISLCISCHAKTNFNRNDWSKYYINKFN
jgi:hypothetical protein